MKNKFVVNFLLSPSPKVRSELIPSPPTYNTKYGYLSWESYYNTSYYTRLLPPVPEDCPLPMGTKGEPYSTQLHTYDCAPENVLIYIFFLQVNLFFRIPKCWLRGFLREINLGLTLREPMWCLPSWPSTSLINSSGQTMKLKVASPRL